MACGTPGSSPPKDAAQIGDADAAMPAGSDGAAAESGGVGSGGVATGGTFGGGGTVATGGTIATGGAGVGGLAATGGAGATGGTTAAGGTTASGGTATGGTTGAGGTGGSGGTPSTGGTLSFSWDFPSDTQEWVGSFSDYPPGLGNGYDLQYGWAALPTEVGPGGGLRLSGNNHSDDLFMYVMRQITGLVPQTRYLLDVVAVIDTNAPADCGGIGGAPGINVSVKIGAVALQPTTSTDSQGWLWLDLDKGTQSTGGADMQVVGNLGNSNTCPDNTYQPKTFTLSGFSVTSAADGTLWLILGTDSGFEGITTLYYDHIAVSLQPNN